MKRIARSISAITIAAPLAFNGCASLPGKEYQYPELSKLLWLDENARVYSPNGSEVDRLRVTDADGMFNLYCRDGRQIRSLKINVISVQSKGPDGLPVDKAQSALEKRSKKSSEIVSTLFHALTFDLGSDYDYNAWSTSGSGTVRDIDKHLNIYALPASSKPLSFDETLKQSQDFKLACGSDFDYGSCEGQSLYFFDRKLPLLLTNLNPNTYSWSEIHSGQIGDGKMAVNFKILATGNKRAFVFGAIKGEVIEVVNPETKVASKATPIRPLQFGESLIFKTRSLLVPSDKQELVFKKPGANFFLNKDGSFNYSDASDPYRTRLMWKQYFIANTQVKEAQTNNPQVVRYEVSLDLSPVCAYGHQMTDLKSK